MSYRKNVAKNATNTLLHLNVKTNLAYFFAADMID